MTTAVLMVCPDYNKMFSFCNVNITKVQHFVFRGKGKGGYLVEGSISIEEKDLHRGVCITYWYGVKKQDKEILGVATRYVHVPPKCKGKESKPFDLRMLTFNCLFHV